MDGRLQTRSYENQEGRRVYVTEVVADNVQFLEPKGSNEQRGAAAGGYYGDPFPFGQDQNHRYPNEKGIGRIDEDPFANDGQPIDISDDDLPF